MLSDARTAKMVTTLIRKGKESVNHVLPAHLHQKVKIKHAKFAEWVNIRMKRVKADAKDALRVDLCR